jgi:hypothetical protein
VVVRTGVFVAAVVVARGLAVDAGEVAVLVATEVLVADGDAVRVGVGVVVNVAVAVGVGVWVGVAVGVGVEGTNVAHPPTPVVGRIG